MAGKSEMLYMADRLRATSFRSKRAMVDEAARLLEEAAEAVERMTPRLVKGIWYPYDAPIGYCPNCDAEVNGTSHCDSCGQALDWGDE